MKRTYVPCFTTAAILIFIGSILLYQGFDKKLHYNNSESGLSSNINTYVGGDAYNYIINSNYFTAYSVLGCTAFICATLFICAGLYFRVKDQSSKPSSVDSMKIVSDELPPL